MRRKYVIAKSKIHGHGVVAMEKIKRNELIGVGITYTFLVVPHITQDFGRWVNHSYSPSARLIYLNKEYYVVANRDLNPGEEVSVNYNTCPWFIQRAKPHYI